MEYQIFKMDGRVGLRHKIPGQEKVLLEPQFDSIVTLEHLLFRTELDGRFGLAGVRIIEENEDKPWKYQRRTVINALFQPEHQSVEIAGSIATGCVEVRVDARHGLLDTYAQRVICQPRFATIQKGPTDLVPHSSGRRTITALQCDELWNYITRDSYEFDRSLNSWVFHESSYERMDFSGPGVVYGYHGENRVLIR